MLYQTYTLKTLGLFLTPMGLNSNPEPGQKSLPNTFGLI